MRVILAADFVIRWDGLDSLIEISGLLLALRSREQSLAENNNQLLVIVLARVVGWHFSLIGERASIH